MDCNRIREQLHRSLDGAPAGSELREHLAACPACRAELTGMRQTVAGLAALPRAASPADLMANVMSAVRQRPLTDVQTQRQQRALSLAAAMLALLGVLLVAVAAGDVWRTLTLAEEQPAAVALAETDMDAAVEVDPVLLAEQLPAAAQRGGAPFAAGLCLLFLAALAALVRLLAPAAQPASTSTAHSQPRASSLQVS